MMADLAAALAMGAAALLTVSFGIWAVWLRGPLMERLDGVRVSNDKPAKLAVMIVIGAFAFSAVAALLAVTAWAS